MSGTYSSYNGFNSAGGGGGGTGPYLLLNGGNSPTATIDFGNQQLINVEQLIVGSNTPQVGVSGSLQVGDGTTSFVGFDAATTALGHDQAFSGFFDAQFNLPGSGVGFSVGPGVVGTQNYGDVIFGSLTNKPNLLFGVNGGLGLFGATSGLFNLLVPTTVHSYTLTLPDAQGGANTSLVNNGSGVLSWATVVTTGTTATVGSGVGTITNLPAGFSGNPTGYLQVTIGGSPHVIPFW